MAKKGSSGGGGGGGKAATVANSSGNVKTAGIGSAIGTGIGTAVGGPVGGAIGGVLGGAAEGAIGGAAPKFTSGITETDINKARGDINQGFRKGSDILRGGVTSGSGVGIGSLTPQTARQRQDDKIRAFAESADFQSKTPAQQKAFIERFREGELGKKGRGLVKEALTGGGGYKYDPATGKYVPSETDPFLTTPSDELRKQGIENTGDIFGEMGDLTSLIGEDVKGALDYKQNLRDYFSNLTGSMDQEGLTAQDQADLDAQYTSGRRRVQETLRDDLQRTMGDLTQRGFSSSSLSNQALQRGAFDPLSRNIVDLEASQAGMRQDILNARTSRRGQAFRNLLGAGAQLGSGGFSSLTSGIVSPSSYGGFTDPQSAEFMYGALTGQSGRQDKRGAALAGIQTTNRMIQY
jgi:hypothetical protein